MSGNSSIFTGASRYASDFQSVIDRAVAIASLPLAQLQTQRTTLSDRSNAFSALDKAFTALQTAISGLNSSAASNSLAASVSDSTVLTATAGSGALKGSYTIDVTSIGSYSGAMSKDGLTAVTDPVRQSISTAASLTLTIVSDTTSTDYTITPAGTSLNDLVAAINAQLPDSVQASIVNVGSGSSADYRLSVQSRKLGDITVKLNDGQELLDMLVTGAKAEYKINGRTTSIESDTRTVTVSPGLTVNLAKSGSATVTVSQSSAGISNALSSFVNAYNAAVTALDAHRGSSAGALGGDSMISSLSQSLRNLANHSEDSGSIRSITDLGLMFDDKGKLSLNTEVFSSATAAGLDAVSAFLGSQTSGGFLQRAANILDSIENSSDGTLKAVISSVTTAMSAQDKAISDQQERIDSLEVSLQKQMAAADSLIASMEQQVLYFTSMFQAMAEAKSYYNN